MKYTIWILIFFLYFHHYFHHLLISNFFCIFQFYLHARVASAPCFRLFFGPFVVIYALLLGAALYVAASRIFDHKHHGVDVLFGALMGTGIAGAMVGPFYRNTILEAWFLNG